jgi:hypothetical protein
VTITIFTTDENGHASVSEYDISDAQGALDYVLRTERKIVSIVIGVSVDVETLYQIVSESERKARGR